MSTWHSDIASFCLLLDQGYTYAAVSQMIRDQYGVYVSKEALRSAVRRYRVRLRRGDIKLNWDMDRYAAQTKSQPALQNKENYAQIRMLNEITASKNNEQKTNAQKTNTQETNAQKTDTQKAGAKEADAPELSIQDWMRNPTLEETMLDDREDHIPECVHIETQSVAVIADVHVPYHSAIMFQRLISMLKHFKVSTLVIAGDLLNMSNLGRHGRTEPHIPVHDELIKAGNLLKWLDIQLQSICPQSMIVIANGNHDERIAAKVDDTFRLTGLVHYMLYGDKLASQLVVTDYDYVRATIAGKPWIFGHLSSYHKRPGEMAQRLASKYKCNVAVGHDHIQGYSSTQDGLFLGISIGSMIDTFEDGTTNLWYKERRLTLYAPTQRGFLIIKEGIPYLFNEHGSSSLNGGMGWDYWMKNSE